MYCEIAGSHSFSDMNIHEQFLVTEAFTRRLVRRFCLSNPEIEFI